MADNIITMPGVEGKNGGEPPRSADTLEMIDNLTLATSRADALAEAIFGVDGKRRRECLVSMLADQCHLAHEAARKLAGA